MVFLSSCASVSVRGEHQTASKKAVQKPAKIYVADFATAGVYHIAGSESKDPETFKKKIAGVLANYTTKSVNDHVAPAERVSSPKGLPRNGWLVTGEFVRVNTGSRVLRAGVGLGAGGSKMETRVTVVDLSSGQAFLTFETTGGSNAMPGLLESSGPGSAVISMTSQAMLGVTDDSARTGRMIAGMLNCYMIDRGWLPKDKKYSAKKLGDYQLIHEQYFH
jgi:hypothetical protein